MTTMKFDGGIEFEPTQWEHRETGVRVETYTKSGEWRVTSTDDGFGGENSISVTGDNAKDRAFTLALALVGVSEGNKKR